VVFPPPPPPGGGGGGGGGGGPGQRCPPGDEALDCGGEEAEKEAEAGEEGAAGAHPGPVPRLLLPFRGLVRIGALGRWGVGALGRWGRGMGDGVACDMSI